MKILKNWRLILLAFLFIWCGIMIHPFTKQAAEITIVESPASIMFQPGDLVYSINNEKVPTYEAFLEIAETIPGNDSVKVTVERETFPYTYTNKINSYITNEDDNPLAFYAKPTSFSKLDFNSQLEDSNKFIISTPDPDNTIDVLSKRFKVARVSDYIFKTQGNDVLLYTSAGREITNLIENTGVFEAKIGDEVIFTDKDIEFYCRSGANCMIHIYQVINQTEDVTEVVWKYAFETRLYEGSAENFGSAVEDLEILSCEYDRCTLNEKLKFYVDGEDYGFENIYASDKDKELTRTFVGGEEKSRADAMKNLYFMQAVLQGRVDAEITGFETVPALTGDNTITIVFAIIGGIILLNSILLLVQFKDIKTAGISIILGVAEIVIVLGVLSGLNFPITLLTVAALITIPLISLIYQNYSIRWIKKEGLILKKINDLNKKLNKWMWILVAVSIVLTMIKSDLGAPILIYLILTVLINKGNFFRVVRAKKS